ncbi:hypothetical protein DYU05_07865 [Mucilaginibacter terrenus]|uniref:Putative auto-transporter adhesin head GIN domain-containing protein n=1 Tax=Mucilaginibacter terrenus TaxID=2482727 RepID=A0A3E2NWX5_9SPHI|nr:DUF2807 domain-containing protein [Mucilaginibacter terrenus]RFZ85503.1 hypothetical protein DYU05_07865 [Mucilaginibacter terrenus]
MKAKFLTIATIITLATATFTTSFAADKNIKAQEEVSTVLSVAQINKIEIRGNVELFVSDGSADQVKVYNRYYAESAMVQNENGVLRIASYTDKKLVVWVTAADLRAISAYDNAEVKSFGNLSKIDLDVTLNNNASAQLNLDAFKASITVNDRAKANISGNVNDCAIIRDQSATLNQTGLVAVNKMEKTTNLFVQPKADVANVATL